MINRNLTISMSEAKNSDTKLSTKDKDGTASTLTRAWLSLTIFLERPDSHRTDIRTYRVGGVTHTCSLSTRRTGRLALSNTLSHVRTALSYRTRVVTGVLNHRGGRLEQGLLHAVSLALLSSLSKPFPSLLPFPKIWAYFHVTFSKTLCGCPEADRARP